MTKNKIAITKEQALAAYGGKNKDLAEALGIKTQNVSMWPEGEPIPRVHALYLAHELKKEHFKKVLK